MDLNQKIVKIVENLINVNKNKLNNKEINENIINSFSTDLTPLELNYLKNKYMINTTYTTNTTSNDISIINNDDTYEQPSKRRRI